MTRSTRTLLACLLTTALVVGPVVAYPANVGFRGGTVEAPENTIATYTNTLTNGGDWLEIDVWSSSDAVPVCITDETVDRTTDGTGIVWQKTLAELKTLDAGSWFDPAFAGEQIPTLEEALALAMANNARVLLDIRKDAYIDEVATAVANAGFPAEDVIGLIRFGKTMMVNFKNQMPDSPGFLSTAGPLYVYEDDVWERASALPRPDAGLTVAVQHILDRPDWVEMVQSYGLQVVTEGVLSPQYQDAIDLGVDGLVVAHPTLLENFLPQPDPECSDGIDNDGDGDVDYPDDPGCFSAFYDYEAPACSDGLDNNGDGNVDFPVDTGCFATFDQREGAACGDGLDNDDDGLVDFPADPGCDSLLDEDECGASDCGGFCGGCPGGEFCEEGTCVDPSPGFSWPTNVGFRGGVAEAPENTLATYDNSLIQGVDWLEFDVWNSSDDVPVCHHDETLDRTTDGTGIIWQHTLAELKELDAGSWYDPAFAGEEIPTLEEGLVLSMGRGKILLDIKHNDYIDEIAQAVTNVGFPPEEVFGWIRSGPGMMTNFKNLMPDSEGFLSTNGPLFVDEEMIWERTQADDRPDYGLIAAWEHVQGNPGWVELIHSYGLRFFTNGVLSPEYNEALQIGADGYVVAHPTLFESFIRLPDPECYDGLDNDGDGDTDFQEDAGCWGPEDTSEAAECSDGLDNDGDGDVDYPDDAGCFSAFYDFEAPQCSDGIDNNGDGDVDYPDDAGCFAAFDQREGLACNDGLDNDGDGLLDFPDDPGCDSAEDIDECGAADCDGPCGDCDGGFVCNAGVCCAPQCDGKVCGGDGCGGSCGVCPPSDVCDPAGSCVCIPDCGGRECGDDGCGGSCGDCQIGETCAPVGLCDCVPDCAGKPCGDDGCGGSCGSCGGGDTCDLLTSECCAPDADGDGVCDANDCAPGDPDYFGTPPEVQDLQMVNRILLAWTSQDSQSGSGTAYQVLKGGLSDLPVGSGSEECLDPIPNAFVFDADDPPGGTGFFYLVRGTTACGDGTYGADSSLGERTSAACP